jgi:2-dehydropantoate 2-reductase
MSLRICIVGSGAIGGLIGVRLSISGQDVTFIDKDEQLAAIQQKGLKLVMQDGKEFVAREAKATGSFEEAGQQDVVILGVKAHQIPEVAPDLPALFGPDTSLVTVQNGIPWWYFQRYGGEYEGKRLEALDPTGVIEANVDADRIIGCVAYPAAAIVEPGVVQHVEGNRFPMGELDGSKSERCKKLMQAFIDAGFRSRVIDNIRAEIWLKAWGTLSFNPISALTHATMVDICHFPETRDLATKMMREAEETAGKLGITFRRTIERRIEGAENVGAHKTSMLQDVEAGRSLEIEALIGAIIELSRLTQTPSPAIDTVYACVKLLNKTFTEVESRVVLSPLD